MANSVRFKFTNDSKPPKNGVFNIKLRIKIGSIKKGRQIGVEVDKDQWDEKNGRIKPTACLSSGTCARPRALTSDGEAGRSAVICLPPK